MIERQLLGVIPARGGSKGIPRKNVRDVAGDPLIAHTIRAGRQASQVDRVIVSSDDEEIREIAREYGADVPFERPADLATDEAPMEPVIEHAVEYLDREENDTYDGVVLLQPTSPLRTATHVDEAVKRFRASPADSLVSVSPDHSYRWRRTENGAVRVNYDERKRRQEKEPELVENGAIYIADVAAFLASSELPVGRVALYEMDEPSSVDVDEPFELWLADRIMSDWRDSQ